MIEKKRLTMKFFGFTGCLLLFALCALAQDTLKLPKRVTIQGTAMGQSTQLGRLVHVKIIINELSSAEEQQALMEAFKADETRGLVNALEKMSAKGRLAVDGTLGYDVNYARLFKKADGSAVLRAVTDRPLRFGEAWAGTRSSDYNLSAFELIFTRDKKGKIVAKGTLLPAAEFKLDDNNKLEIKLYQNPWKLDNITISGLPKP